MWTRDDAQMTESLCRQTRGSFLGFVMHAKEKYSEASPITHSLTEKEDVTTGLQLLILAPIRCTNNGYMYDLQLSKRNF